MQIKTVPEDFRVDEISTLPEQGEGQHTYWYLRKRDETTLRACKEIAFQLKLRLDDIGFAGYKDKKAVTKQLISLRCSQEKGESFKHEKMTLEYIGSGKEAVKVGTLQGNAFTIVVRDLEEDVEPRNLARFVNYFGTQRFGKNNLGIARELMKRNYKEAVTLVFKTQKMPGTPGGDARQNLKKLPRQLLRLLIHSYQSWIFNETVKQVIEGKDLEEMENKEIPLVGFGIEYTDKEIENIIKNILKAEGITERDFIFRDFPELSCEGDMRSLFADIHNLVIGAYEDDELHAGKKKWTLTFSLDKGCYATVVIDQLFS